MKTTLQALAAVALHQMARTLHSVVRDIRPTGVCIPVDSDVTVVTSPWFYTKNHSLVIADQDDPVFVFPSQFAQLPLGITVATTLDNGNDASDHAMVYVLFTRNQDPWALYGRDEEGYFLDQDMREVV